MASRTKRSAPASRGIREPKPLVRDLPEAIEVDGAEGGETTIVVDATTGQTTRTNPDGSVTVGIAGQPRKDRGAARFDDNLAEDPEIAALLPTIAMRLLEAIDNDLQSRRDWEETAKRGIDLLGVKLEQPSAEIGADGTISKIKHVGLKRAVISSWAKSRAELLPVGGPVKVRDDAATEDAEIAAGAPDLSNVVPMPGASGIAPPGYVAGRPGTTERRNALANAFERDFNHYLTVIDKPYYPDTSRMLVSRALLGPQFKKIYRDPILKRPVSRWVKGTDLIISNEATSVHTAARVTEQIPMRQSLARRYMASGHWRKVSLVQPTNDVPNVDRKIAQSEGISTTPILPSDYQHLFYECHCELDDGRLAKDETGREPGYPLPYRVTIDKDSRLIVEIRRNWKRGDEEHQARRRYVKYGFVPSLGFYDWGLVHLVGDPERGATMVEQALLDTGMIANFPGGVMAKGPGTRQRSTQVRPGLGEFVVMDTGGRPLTDIIMPWPYKEPSAVLQAIGADLASQINQVAGVLELPIGEGRIGNTPVGTIMAYIETVTMVPSAVHKDDHIAQQEEFELLRDLFSEDPESLVRGARKPARKWMAAEEIADQDLVPAADPNVPSQAHRLMQVQMLNDVGKDPAYQGIANRRAIYETTVRTIGFSNTGEYTLPEQPLAAPPPDPKVVAAGIKAQDSAQDRVAKANLQHQKDTAAMDRLQVQEAGKAEERQSEEGRALVKAHSDKEDRAVGRAHDLMKHGAGIAADLQKHSDGLGHDRDARLLDHVEHLNTLMQPPEPPASDGGTP